MMSDERPEYREGFLQRWSRLKTDPEQQTAEPVARTPASADAQSEAPVLPPLEELTLDSDFRGFFHPKVDEKLRRAALRKLFSDPHFNVMDGLDTYIDDYSKSDPIPAEMLAGMKQAQRILDWAKGKDDAAEEKNPDEAPIDEAATNQQEVASHEPAAIPAALEPQTPAALPTPIEERDPIPSQKT
jgi:hypothetical protein